MSAIGGIGEISPRETEPAAGNVVVENILTAFRQAHDRIAAQIAHENVGMARGIGAFLAEIQHANGTFRPSASATDSSAPTNTSNRFISFLWIGKSPQGWRTPNVSRHDNLRLLHEKNAPSRCPPAGASERDDSGKISCNRNRLRHFHRRFRSGRSVAW